MEVSANKVNALAARYSALPWVEEVSIGRDDARISDTFSAATGSPWLTQQEVLPWGVDNSGAMWVHTGSDNTGAGVKVAVLDTGINCGNPDLVGHTQSGFDFINMTASGGCGELRPHGTAVAGIIAAANNGSGVIGMAPDAEIYSVRICDENGNCSDAAIASGIHWARNNGMDVINMSLADCGGDPSPAIQFAIQLAVDAGIVVVVSAGNGSALASTLFGLVLNGCPSTSPPSSYANNPEVIAVGAFFPGDTVGVGYQFGSRIDLVGASNVLSDSAHNSTAIFSGTSASAPHVSGAAALLLAAGVAPSQVKSKLTGNARDLGAPGKDNFFGWGALDALSAVIPAPRITHISWCTTGVIFSDCIVTANTVDGVPALQWRFEITYSNGVLPPLDTGWGPSNSFNVTVPSGNYSIEVKATAREHPTGSPRNRTGFPSIQYLAVCSSGGGGLDAICTPEEAF
ncbi:MAG: S8 family serine peptidase [Gemmatimonadales bacterium]|nr:S8 family serine peptidase [Gemmatimonadales bacterium]MDZ4389936.1 S8 family serine peptidase [Gemmatimonadales bacterium]